VIAIGHSGESRNPVRYACEAHISNFECFALRVSLDPGLRRDDGEALATFFPHTLISLP
jgi:hypothetical protein